MAIARSPTYPATPTQRPGVQSSSPGFASVYNAFQPGSASGQHARPTPPTDPNFTGAGAAEQEAQRQRTEWLTAFNGRVDAWTDKRRPYWQSVYDTNVAANRQAVDIQAADNRQQEQYEMARRGTRGSAIAKERTGRLNAAYAGQLAQVQDRASGVRDAARISDLEAAQQYRMLAQQYRPGEDFIQGVSMEALMDDSRFQALLAQAADLAYQGRMDNEELQSRIYAGQADSAGSSWQGASGSMGGGGR